MNKKVKIDIHKIRHSRISEIDMLNLQFGKYFSDHMFIADYNKNKWRKNEIVPYSKLSLSPACSMIHYGQAIFEGMKAYKNEKGEILIFRPLAHLERMNNSARRMVMPEIPKEIFIGGLTELLSLDKAWIPSTAGGALYVRPFYISDDEFLGVKPAVSYKFMIITSPVGSYYSGTVKVLVETNYTRADEGGVGYVKASGNYGRSLLPTQIAEQKGYQQIVRTDSKTHRFVEESGTMNLMFIINGVLITPPLNDTILPGITRDSILQLARKKRIKVQERAIAIDEIIDAHEKGLLEDAFGTGTAATITHISHIGYKGKDYKLPIMENRVISTELLKDIDAIKRGNIFDTYDWVFKI